MMDYEDDKETVVIEDQVGETKEVSLEKTLVFEHDSASLSSAHDLPPAWAWAGTQSEKMKENLVKVIFGQSIKSDLAQITFKKVGVLMRKERLAIFAAWDQTKVLEEWQMAPHNLMVEDALTMLTPAYDYVNVSNALSQQEFIIKVKLTSTNEDILQMIHKKNHLDPQ